MKNKILSQESLNAELATLLLRIILGGLFIYHGYSKLEAYDRIAPMFPDLIGIGGKLSFNLVIFAEFGCGILITLGFLTRLTIIPIFITMLVVFFIAHADAGFNDKELPFTFLLLCIVVFISGSGKYSADNLIFKK